MTYDHSDRRAGKQAAVKLTRTQRRQVEKLAARIDKVTLAHARFFERFPHRQHRIRIASQAEIEQDRAFTGSEMALPWRKRLFVAVKNRAPGVGLRLFVVGPRDADTDLSEEQARLVYEAGSVPEPVTALTAVATLPTTSRPASVASVIRVCRIGAGLARPLVSMTTDNNKCREIEAQLLELAEVLG